MRRFKRRKKKKVSNLFHVDPQHLNIFDGGLLVMQRTLYNLQGRSDPELQATIIIAMVQSWEAAPPPLCETYRVGHNGHVFDGVVVPLVTVPKKRGGGCWLAAMHSTDVKTAHVLESVRPPFERQLVAVFQRVENLDKLPIRRRRRRRTPRPFRQHLKVPLRRRQRDREKRFLDDTVFGVGRA